MNGHLITSGRLDFSLVSPSDPLIHEFEPYGSSFHSPFTIQKPLWIRDLLESFPDLYRSLLLLVSQILPDSSLFPGGPCMPHLLAFACAVPSSRHAFPAFLHLGTPRPWLCFTETFPSQSTGANTPSCSSNFLVLHTVWPASSPSPVRLLSSQGLAFLEQVVRKTGHRLEA